ncbi:lytic murein transglycosylase [Thiohalorhabdus methylotrophus]|uniref:Lytic murein transglycosylase n=1 Tax=Thiohalorhabdus methylotrophus TaxID=3242694 RepID=A0ABV4TZM3_9GAMM
MLIFGLAPALAVATDLEGTARQFEHPDRYRVLFSRLIDRGISPERIEDLFSSEKAGLRDEKAVRLRTDISQIPKHKAAERKANRRYVYEAKVLAKNLREYAPVYERMEEEYGIRKEIIGAILLKESALGRYDSFGHDAFVVFNSLLDSLAVGPDASLRMKRRVPRLLDMAAEQLVALVLYAERQGIKLAETPIRASYAGAVGIPQFLPANMDHAVSAGEAPPDLTQLPDAILSAANLIRNKFGWPDEQVDFGRLDNLDRIVEAWLEFDDGRASFAMASNADGQELRRFDKAHSDIPNVEYVGSYVRAIMRYNYSSDYALGVLQIANRVNTLMEEKESL